MNRHLVLVVVLVLDWVACLRGRGRARRRVGSWSQCMRKNERGLSMNRPTPDPSQEGSERSSAPCQFPSWEGLGVGSWSQCTAKMTWRRSMIKRLVIFAAIFAAWQLGGRVHAADTNHLVLQETIKTEDFPDEQQKLGPGDRVTYRVIEDEDEPRSLTVTDSGDLEVPY